MAGDKNNSEYSADGDVPPKLSQEDLQRVEKYLASPVHQVSRKPFRPWLMMLGLTAVILLLGSISWVISRIVLG